MTSKTKLLGNPRCDAVGKLRMMAGAEGYVMVRRPGAAPFIMMSKDWEALPVFGPEVICCACGIKPAPIKGGPPICDDCNATSTQLN